LADANGEISSFPRQIDEPVAEIEIKRDAGVVSASLFTSVAQEVHGSDASASATPMLVRLQRPQHRHRTRSLFSLSG
jgi:hypothetical protein